MIENPVAATTNRVYETNDPYFSCRDIDEICFDINSMRNNKGLSNENEPIIKKIFNDSIDLIEDSKNEKLKKNLKEFIDDIFKINDLLLSIKEQALQVLSIIDPAKPAMEYAKIESNIFYKLKNREMRGSCLSRDQTIIHDNIKNGNYLKNIISLDFPHSSFVSNFDIQGDLAVIDDTESLIIYDLKRNESLWRSPVGLKLDKIKICKGHVLCSETGRYHIFEIKTGESKVKDLPIKDFCVKNKQIFGINRNKHCIEELNFEGELVNSISLGNDKEMYNLILFSNNFLVALSKNKIFIYDLSNKTVKTLSLMSVDAFSNNISSACIDGNFLTCGLNSIVDDEFSGIDLIKIDLKKGSIINQYIVPMEFRDLDNRRKVNKLIINKGLAYLGYNSGEIVALNLLNKECVLVGKHKECITELVIDGQILMSSSRIGNPCFANPSPAQVKFWDLNSMKLINEMEFPYSVFQCKFIDGKLYAGVDKSFIQWDYFVSHEGEKFTATSETRIKECRRH
jgi:hypothetical protein